VLARYYACHAAHRVYFERVIADCRGKSALEYGCGAGLAAYPLAVEGARVAGIDISDVAIAQAQDEAARRGLSIDFRVGDAERMPFGDGAFDLVCGSGILHHLNIRPALTEVARVLKPEGRAVFIEPLGHNPLVNLFRRLTPGLRTADEHPLLAADLAHAGERFAEVRVHYFDLFSLFAIPLLRFGPGESLFRLLERLDAAAFAGLPFTRHHAGFVVVEAARPLT